MDPSFKQLHLTSDHFQSFMLFFPVAQGSEVHPTSWSTSVKSEEVGKLINFWSRFILMSQQFSFLLLWFILTSVKTLKIQLRVKSPHFLRKLGCRYFCLWTWVAKEMEHWREGHQLIGCQVSKQVQNTEIATSHFSDTLMRHYLLPQHHLKFLHCMLYILGFHVHE